jgi:hypothetical protein
MKNFVFILALAFLSATAFGQKVNLSGDWKLNESKSELGYEFSLAPKAMKVEHTKKTLDVTNENEWDGQEYVSKIHYTLDGEVTENVGFMESVTKSTATFDKKTNTIKMITKGSYEGGEYTSTQIMEMKEENLVVAFEGASDMGVMVEKYVFDKK